MKSIKSKRISFEKEILFYHNLTQKIKKEPLLFSSNGSKT